MICWGHKSPESYGCFAANYSYCILLPIHPLLEGGDPNAMLGVIKVLGVSAALQQTLLIVSATPFIQY